MLNCYTLFTLLTFYINSTDNREFSSCSATNVDYKAEVTIQMAWILQSIRKLSTLWFYGVCYGLQ